MLVLNDDDDDDDSSIIYKPEVAQLYLAKEEL